MFVLFFNSIIKEINGSPIDLFEEESESVFEFNVECLRMEYALIFLPTMG
jgi:NADH:ubiquinone oxidoreductase subunit H